MSNAQLNIVAIGCVVTSLMCCQSVDNNLYIVVVVVDVCACHHVLDACMYDDVHYGQLKNLFAPLNRLFNSFFIFFFYIQSFIFHRKHIKLFNRFWHLECNYDLDLKKKRKSLQCTKVINTFGYLVLCNIFFFKLNEF